jgi:hypothetical protein
VGNIIPVHSGDVPASGRVNSHIEGCGKARAAGLELSNAKIVPSGSCDDLGGPIGRPIIDGHDLKI